MISWYYIKYALTDSWFSFSEFLTHLLAWPCGSIINGLGDKNDENEDVGNDDHSSIIFSGIIWKEQCIQSTIPIYTKSVERNYSQIILLLYLIISLQKLNVFCRFYPYHLRELSTMTPLSTEKLSVGKPAMFHARILIGSPSTLLNEKSFEQLMPRF